MTHEGTEAPRDPARPADYFRQVAAAAQTSIDNALGYGNPRLFQHLPPRYLRLASALYSAGAAPDEVLGALGGAATYEERYIREAKNFRDDAYRDMEEYLDIFGAAALAGSGPQLADAFRRTSFDEEPPAEDESIMRQLSALVAGEPLASTKGDEAAAKRLAKGWKSVPPLLAAAAARDIDAFGPALETYLTTLWGPPTERWAKGALKSQEPEYYGKWSFFSAALCQMVGAVPSLSDKALQYVPVDLVGSSKRA